MTNFTQQGFNWQKRAALRGSVATAALSLAMLMGPSAFAQDTAAAATAADAETIIVTGSRISRPNLDSSSPVSFVGSEEVELRAATNAEQFLRELPGAVPSIGSAVNNGNGGASFVNLRGLGSNRNLVLLNGVRIVPTDLNARVDLNVIPLAVIERTDILTGGATTVYGADAVAGVVNFITKRDFAGVEVSASTGLTSRGDGQTFRMEATVGANFDDGRGNAVLSIGYQNTKPVFQGDRSFSQENIDSFSGQAGGSSAAVPSVIAGYGGPLRQLTDDGGLAPFYAPYNFNPTNIFQTPFKRFSMYGAARYEIADSAEVYTEALFSKNRVETIIAPGGTFFNTWKVPLSNPFLPQSVLDAYCAGAGLDAAACSAAAATTDPNDPNYVEVNSQVRRRFVEAGTRDTSYQTTMFNMKAGVRGDFAEKFSYDGYVSYGESDRIGSNLGWGQFSKVQQALRAVDANTCQDTSDGCVPLNLFGPSGSITPEMLAFVQANDNSTTNRVTLATVSGSVSSGDLFTFGTASDGVGFAVGAEWREYTARQVSDSLSKIPGEVLGSGGADPDIYGKYNVTELFGELIVPVIQDRPFFQDLTLELGARYSDYSTAGTEFTWKVGGQWQLLDGFRVRGNYQRGSRAPNISELFSPVQVGLDNLANDPCAGAGVLSDATLASICVAQGAPTSLVSSGGIAQPAAGQINVTLGGNLDLQTETADTWTLGVVIAPPSIPSLSVTIDYYSIIVNNAITSPTVGDSLDACFAFNRDPGSAECLAIRRNPLTGGLDGSPVDTPGVPLLISNQGRLETDGIDLSARWTGDLGFGSLGLSFDGNWTNRSLFKASAGSINRECVGYYSVNCLSIQPEFSFNQRTSLNFDNGFTLSLLWRWLSGVDYEPAQLAADIDAGGGPQDEFLSIGATSYFDLSGRFNIGENLTVTLSMLNMFDHLPKVVGSTIGTTAYNSGNVYPSTYDPLGRRFNVAVRLRF